MGRQIAGYHFQFPMYLFSSLFIDRFLSLALHPTKILPLGHTQGGRRSGVFARQSSLQETGWQANLQVEMKIVVKRRKAQH